MTQLDRGCSTAWANLLSNRVQASMKLKNFSQVVIDADELLGNEMPKVSDDVILATLVNIYIAMLLA